jgi:hypothetical protein
MLDANDIQVLRSMFGEFEEKIDKKFDRKLDALRVEIKKDLGVLRIEIRDDVIAVIEDNIQPQLNQLNARVTRLERMILV